MDYRLEMDINRPRAEVLHHFLDVDSLKDWQTSLVSITPLDDLPPRSVGAKTEQVHRMGKREVTMTETITVNDPPEHFAAIYAADGVWNQIENRFTENPDGTTHWVCDNEFRCTGFMRVMAFLFPGMFRKQTREFMEMFRDYVESRPT